MYIRQYVLETSLQSTPSLLPKTSWNKSFSLPTPITTHTHTHTHTHSTRSPPPPTHKHPHLHPPPHTPHPAGNLPLHLRLRGLDSSSSWRLSVQKRPAADLDVRELLLELTPVVVEVLRSPVAPAEVPPGPEQDVEGPSRAVEVGGPVQVVLVLVQHDAEDRDAHHRRETCKKGPPSRELVTSSLAPSDSNPLRLVS